MFLIFIFIPTIVLGRVAPCFPTVIQNRPSTPKQPLGFASDDNFSVIAPSQGLADEVLKKANELRTDITQKWLRKKLKDGDGRAIIKVKLSNSSNTGNTWKKDPPIRTNYVVEVSAKLERLYAILAHEITHVIFLETFKEELPIWADEGIACLQEDEESLNARCRIAKNSAQATDRSKLENLFKAVDVPGEIRGSDSIATSLVQFFVARGGEEKFIAFSMDGKKEGWDVALFRYYKIKNIDELKRQWQDWLTKK